MPEQDFMVSYSPARGLVINWCTPQGMRWQGMPVRVQLRGTGVFSVWSEVDSGEGAPLWAEPELALTFSPLPRSPAIEHRVERISTADGGVGYRAIGRGERAAVTLEFRLEGDELRTMLSVHNPQPPQGRALPLCVAELCFEEMSLGQEAIFVSALSYGGQSYGYGKVAELNGQGVSFAHGCIGLTLPLVYLYDARNDIGWQFEFMLEPSAR